MGFREVLLILLQSGNEVQDVDAHILSTYRRSQLQVSVHTKAKMRQVTFQRHIRYRDRVKYTIVFWLLRLGAVTKDCAVTRS